MLYLRNSERYIGQNSGKYTISVENAIFKKCTKSVYKSLKNGPNDLQIGTEVIFMVLRK